MKLGLNNLKKIVRAIMPARPGETAQLEADKLKHLIRGIITAHADEVGCDECFEQLNRFVEMELDGKNAAEAMPLIQDHLEHCGNCCEEFEALLAALHALT